jgi:N-acetylglutamate synthase-like GNAT family acetyltransferase
MNVRRLGEDDRPWLRRILSEGWGGESMTGHGERFFPAEHDGFVAGDRAGVVTYRIADGACEITMIESYDPGKGVGSALLEAVVGQARAAGCSRVWLVTTNDNAHAQDWYRARGFVVTEVRPGAVDEARRTLKPSIPERGAGGVRISDEIEMSLDL